MIDVYLATFFGGLACALGFGFLVGEVVEWLTGDSR